MTHTRLEDIVNPWVKKLDLPNGWRVQPWSNSKVGIIRGQTHWYVHFVQGVERWFMTVRGDHVEVRDNNDLGPKVLNSHTISAADPEFFVKMESDIRAALDYLARS